MRRNTGSTWVVLTAFALFALSIVPSAYAHKCSLTNVAGNYGFSATGTLLPPTGPVPIAAIGRISLKADGSLSGTEARSVGGGFANETLTGTWTVSPDCTGALTAQIFESGALVRTSVLSFVVDDDMKETRNVQQSLTLPDGTNLPVVVTFEARRVFSRTEETE
jgi:hypothetical protein